MKFYDQLSRYYDLFIDWDERMKNEDRFFQHIFRECLASSILDMGCGTGGHALYWAEAGLNTVGIDSSPEMIERAKERAEAEELDVEFECLPLTHFADKLQQQFGAVVCVGNTLPHLLEFDDLLKCFQQAAAAMKPSGAAIFHCLNYLRILEVKKRDFPTKSRVVDGVEYVFSRFYDFDPKHLRFHFVVSVKEDVEWKSKSFQMLHKPWRHEQLVDAARQAGFTQIMAYGGYDFSEFVESESSDLVLVCEMGETDYQQED